MAGRGIKAGVAGVAEDRAAFRLKRVMNPEKLGKEFFHFLLPADRTGHPNDSSQLSTGSRVHEQMGMGTHTNNCT